MLHELGHALQARRDGVEIDGITLWLFGGVARFSAPFPSPGAELRIALAGPAVSLGLGIGLILAAALLPLPVPLEGMLAWLGFINLVLLAFNLLPALPLDGGRVVRAALWRLRGDFVAATRIAAGLGRLFGALLVALGIALLPADEAFAAIWVVLIGWFVLLAAEAERRDARDRSALEGFRVRDVMVEDPAVVAPDTPLRELAQRALCGRHRSYPVVDGDRPLGLVSIRAASALAGQRPTGGRVGDHMVPLASAPILSPDQPASDALAELARSELGLALVCHGGHLVGVVSISDVGRVLEYRTSEGKAGRAALAADERGRAAGE